ncbi:MAG: ABC transporter ATP-binding protein/permease [Planctomycetales bacterium]
MLRYPFRLVAIAFCALMVGFLWGANLGAVYPLIEIVFNNDAKNPREWARGQLQDAVGQAAEFDVSLAIDDARLEAADNKQAARKLLQQAEQRLEQREDLRADALVSLREQLHAAIRDPGSSDVEPLNDPPMVRARLEAEEHAVALWRWCGPLTTSLPQDRFSIMAWLVGLLFVGTLVKSLFFMAHRIVSESLVQLSTMALRQQFYRTALQMDDGALDENGTPDLISRFTHDVEGVGSGLNAAVGLATREPLKILCCLIGAAWICFPLLIFSILVVPLGAVVIHRLSKLLKNANRKAMEGMSVIYEVLNETLMGIQIVKSFTMERHERGRFHRTNKNYYFNALRIARYNAMINPVTESVGVITLGVTLLAGAHLVISNDTHLFGMQMTSRPLSLGELLTFYALLAGMSTPGRKLSGLYSRLQRSAAAADRIYAVIDREPKIKDPEHPRRLGRHQRDLVLEDVSFSYDGTTPVLQGINLKIPFGETIALVGPNGCGKSTLLKLIARFVDPTSGRVLLDGTDLREARLRDIRSQIGLVSQRTILFRDTVLNNIRYGSRDRGEADAAVAAKSAYAHDFIEEIGGYDTVLGSRALSGGQEQRIALARAILRDPPLFFLDEATSQIDLESEQLIHKALKQFTNNRTTIIVTHRLSTLALADRVVVMEAGRVVDVGRHEELLARCPAYCRLHQTQLKDAG